MTDTGTTTKEHRRQGYHDGRRGSPRASEDEQYRRGYADGLKSRVRANWVRQSPPIPGDLRSVYRATKDRSVTIDLTGIAQIPSDCDRALRFGDSLTDEQESRCAERIREACDEIKRRVYFRKLGPERIQEDDHADD